MNTVHEQEKDPLVAELEREFAPGWAPSKGDRLIGQVVDLSIRRHEYGDYPVVTMVVENADEVTVASSADGKKKTVSLESTGGGNVAFHAQKTRAIRRLTEAGVEIGDRVAIQYLGQSDEEWNGRTIRPHNYKIVNASKPAPAFAWDQFGDDGGDGQTGDVGPDVPADTAGLGTTSAGGETHDDIPF